MTDVQQVINPTVRFDPYPYQMIPFEGLASGKDRGILVWPRRAGKDLTAINICWTRSQMRVGTYFYILPTQKQAKRIVWDGMDDSGIPFRNYIPEELVAPDGWNESELQVTLRNGSIIQLMGSDHFDTSGIGTNCVGAIFSEYALQKPTCYNYVRPILRKNHGWALFLYTPRGRNHGYELFERNKDNPRWFVSKLEAPDILDWQGNRLITEEMLAEERREGMSEEYIQQEYYTSFSGIQQGSYFGDQLLRAEAEDRFGMYPYDPSSPVHTVSDLGTGVRFASWFFQVVNNKVNWLEFHENVSGGVHEFIKYCRTKNVIYGGHYAPFDINTKDVFTGEERIIAAAKLGFHFRKLAKTKAIGDRIEAARRVLPISTFLDREVGEFKGCKRGLDVLRSYHRQWDEIKQEYTQDEVHDWASHGGSSFTYGAVAFRSAAIVRDNSSVAETDFDEMENPRGKSYDTDFDEFGASAEECEVGDDF